MIVIELDSQKSKILLSNSNDSIILNSINNTPIHNHVHCEIHLINKGEAAFIVEGTEYLVPEHHAILIPAPLYHSVIAKGDELERICFHGECEVDQVVVKPIAGDLIKEIADKVRTSDDLSVIYNHLFFILNELADANKFILTPVKDYTLQIREFFSLNYQKNVTISDLAEELFLSNMQAQRVTKKYTGKTFGENLLLQRMIVAENLMKTTKMSLSEIAAYVGYNSYCGFWKAYKKYQNEEKTRH